MRHGVFDSIALVMQQNNSHHTQKQKGTTPTRVAYTFTEYAGMFGKSRDWTYRQVRSGHLRAITGYGTMMIPASELARMMNQAGGQEP